MEGLIFGLCVGAVLIVIAGMRSGTAAANSKPSNLRSFLISDSPEEVMKTIVRFAQMQGYKISMLDAVAGKLVLDEGASLTSCGFFYPVFVSKSMDGKTLVEVGIKPKIFQVGPIVTRSHEKVATGIQAALFAK